MKISDKLANKKTSDNGKIMAPGFVYLQIFDDSHQRSKTFM
jgi:hypothetical protein